MDAIVILAVMAVRAMRLARTGWLLVNLGGLPGVCTTIGMLVLAAAVSSLMRVLRLMPVIMG